MPKSPKNIFKIGYISKTHGLKGEVTVILDSVTLPEAVEKVFLELNGVYREYTAIHFSARPDKAFIKLTGVDDLESAQALRGYHVYLERKGRSKPSSDMIFEDELIGYMVIDSDDTELGVIRQIIGHSGNRLFEVINGRKEILIPVNGPYIQEIDSKKKKILVDLPEGFLEL